LRAEIGTKFFQAFPRKIQAFPRKFQTFPSFFQGIPNIFLGRFQRNQGVVAGARRFPLFFARASEFPSRRHRARRTPRTRKPPPPRKRRRSFPFTTISIFPEENVAGAPASACPQGSPGGARHPRKGGRIAETAPNGSKRVRWFAADFRHRPGG
jgi:hypothetical protein